MTENFGKRAYVRGFWGHVDKSGQCWIWNGTLDRDGYGKHYESAGRGRMITRAAHRHAYELAHGPIADGLTIDHLCRNRACVNPDHLEAVSFAENIHRRSALLTHCKHGHEFTPENTQWESAGSGRPAGRRCRTCRLNRKRNASRAA